MAFDPGTDDPELLRTVIQLLRLSALTASNRADRDGIHTAEEKIAEVIEGAVWWARCIRSRHLAIPRL